MKTGAEGVGLGPAPTDQLASARIAVATMASASSGVNPPCPVAIRYTARPEDSDPAPPRGRTLGFQFTAGLQPRSQIFVTACSTDVHLLLSPVRQSNHELPRPWSWSIGKALGRSMARPDQQPPEFRMRSDRWRAFEKPRASSTIAPAADACPAATKPSRTITASYGFVIVDECHHGRCQRILRRPEPHSRRGTGSA